MIKLKAIRKGYLALRCDSCGTRIGDRHPSVNVGRTACGDCIRGAQETDVVKMKKAYDTFIKIASKVAVSRDHQAILLDANSAYNRFLAGLHS